MTPLLTAVLFASAVATACGAAPAANGDERSSAVLAPCDRDHAVTHYEALQRGDRAEASRLLSDCRRVLSERQPDGWAAFAAMRSRYLIDTDDWTGDVAALTVPDVDPAATFIFEYANGFVAVRTRVLPAVRAALSKMEHARQAVATRQNDGEAAYRQVMRDEVGIMLGAAEGAAYDGIRRLERLVVAEDALPRPDGPPSFGKPTWELLGEMYLDVVNAEAARRAFEKALERTPGRMPALAGLVKAASLSGDERTRNDAQSRIDAIRRPKP
jgi:hypothetical protein